MVITFVSANRIARLVFSLLLTAITALALPARAGFDEFSVGGDATAASIQPTVDAFRAAIGGANNGNAPGPIAGGRREINWDGGGAMTAAFSPGALTAFTNTRGATFINPSLAPNSGLLQTPLNAVELTGIQASYQTTFSTFSPLRIFTPIGLNITEVTFSLPGTAGATPATVSAFGAVFTDVDLADTTTIELFNPGNASLGEFDVLPGAPGAASTAALSFLGLVANAGERIASITITTGNQALGQPDSNGSPVDVVAMDDFLYAEPVFIPEPASEALAVMAIIGVALVGVRRGDGSSSHI